MAIVKMKKLRLVAPRSSKEALLRDLLKAGCVEFSEIGDEIREDGLEGVVTKENSDIMLLRSRQTTLNTAIAVLDRYAPEKKPLLSAKPEIDADALINFTGTGAALAKAEEINALEDKLKRIASEQSRLRSTAESLEPWKELDMPLETTGTGTTAVTLGTIPAREDLGAVTLALGEVTDEAELFGIHSDKAMHYLVLVCIKEKQSEAMDALRRFGFAVSNLSGLTGTPAENIAGAEAQQKALETEKEETVAAIVAEAGERVTLKTASDAVGSEIERAAAEDTLYGMKSAVIMQGWLPAEKEAEITAIFEKYGCAYETTDPEESEYPDVPVKLKNNKVTDALNMVTEMYSLPAYGSVDPNPLMAPFFILFYGLMMADMGYGILMILAAVIAMKKMKPREGSLTFCRLLLWGGISTFVMGAVTGGFFGDALVKIGQLLGKPDGWGELPALFSPLDDTLYVLIGAMVLGVIHLNFGMLINCVKEVKRGQIMDAVFNEGALWVTLAGIILYVFKLGNVAGIPVVLVIGILMIFYGGTRSAKGFGKVTSIFGTLYNTLTGWFGDILSYSRIMALMLAGSVIAQVFNTIAVIANNFIVFIIIFLIGHALNFGLNLLGCYVHDLRLQCLEFFGKFYEDGGRAFAPLRFRTKYFNIKE